MNFREKTTAAFGIALVIFLTIAFFSYHSVLRSDEDRMWVLHSHEVREQANQILTDLLNAETGERGYILTGQRSFLDPYNR